MRFRQVILVLFVALTAMGQGYGNPQLLFDESDLPALRQWVQDPEVKPLWDGMLQRARGYCDKNSSSYVSIEELKTPPGDRPKVYNHMLGRRLRDWMQDIGLAYHITQDEPFAEHGAMILVETARAFPVTQKFMKSGFAGGRGDVARGLAIGYDLFAEVMTDAEKELVAKTAAGYIEHILDEGRNPATWWYRYHNYNGVSIGAAGLLAVAIKDIYPERASAWIDECETLVGYWFDDAFDENGAYVEGVSYGTYGLSNALPFAWALDRMGRPGLLHHPRLQKSTQFFVMSLLPGEGVCEARNDSNYDGPKIAPLVMAGAHNDGVAKWLWERTRTGDVFMRILMSAEAAQVEPVDPMAAGVSLAQLFPDRGLAIWRTGWDRDDVMYSVEAGPYYEVTHDQADEGHFTFYGLGYRWAVDAQYANNHEPEGRAQTIAHNCVLIDGKGQALSGAGLGTNGRTVIYEDNDVYGYSQMDCREAFVTNIRNQVGDRYEELADGMQIKHAIRHSVYIKPSHGASAYAVLMDDIAKDAEAHEYTWQMYTDPSMQVTENGSGWLIQPDGSSGNAFVTTSADARAGNCTLVVDIARAGEYVLWARLHAKDASQNSFWVQCNGSAKVLLDWNPSSSWTWARLRKAGSKEAHILKLDRGEHRLVFSTREGAAELDCVLLVPNTDDEPQGKRPEIVGAVFAEAEDGQVVRPMRVHRDDPVRVRMIVALDAKDSIQAQHEMREFSDRKGMKMMRLHGVCEAVNPYYVAVLMPLPGDMATPTIEFVQDNKQRRILVDWPNRQDVIVWPEAHGAQPHVLITN